MTKFQNYLNQFDRAATVTDEELARTQILLELYAPTMRSSVRAIEEMEGFLL